MKVLQSMAAAAGKVRLAGPFVAFSVWSALSWGDDIDIYFNSTSIQDLGIRPNIMFILDTSGSMEDGNASLSSISLPTTDAVRSDLGIGSAATSNSKIFHMKSALYDFLNDVDLGSEINVGLMRFNRRSAAVVYPVSELDTHRTELIDALAKMRVGSTNTPIVDSLYEAALYYRGDHVFYGVSRGTRGVFSDIHHSSNEARISHPDSVVPGTATATMPSGCSLTNLNAEACEDRRWQAGGSALATNQDVLNYKSPIANQCQPNHIVLLTDGAANWNRVSDEIADMIGMDRDDCDSAGDTDLRCGVDLTRYLATQDQVDDATLADEQTVTTHVIGFNFSTSWLEDLASAGGGGYHTAASASDLTAVLSNITSTVLNANTTFTAPVATINQFNRLNHKDEIYFAVFRPEETRRWPGNVKKYKLAVVNDERNVIVDASNNPAIDPATGFFKEASKDLLDGSVGTPTEYSVEAGGVGMKVATSNRKVYTWLRSQGNIELLTSAVNNLHESNSLITKAALGVVDDTSSSDDEDERTAILQWARGYDAATNSMRQGVGDPLHSRPVVVSYSDTDAKIFFGTNEGFLHAFDAEDGSDLFSFMPEELLGNLKPQYNGDSGEHIYGVDGPVTFWTHDKDPDPNDATVGPNGVIQASDGDEAYLFFGLRRGGSSYYALDIVNPEVPSVAWDFKSGDTGFEELGQSWARPIKTVVRVNAGTVASPVPVDKHVLFISGGYDDSQDADTAGAAKTRSVDNIGRAIYMVDAQKGTLLWKADINDYPAMKYSIPASVAVADTDQSGTADQIYVGDMGGQVWRFDIDNGAVVSNIDTYYGDNFIKGGVIADLATSSADANVASARRFYHSPDVALSKEGTNTFVAVTIGSGWRAKPNDKEVTDRFYMLRVTSPYSALDFNSFTTITEDRMADLTNTIGTAASAAVRGASSQSWYITMENSGEKVLSTPLTIGGAVIFTTYEPNATLVDCVPTPGTSREYVLKLTDATPVIDFDVSGNLTKADRSKQLLSGTIVDEPVLIFTNDGGSTFVGTEKGGFEIENRATRTFWHKEQ